jgi:hypothetical protein
MRFFKYNLSLIFSFSLLLGSMPTYLNAIIDIIQLLPDDAKEIIIKNIK